MGNFSFMIQKKFRDLNSEQQNIFIGEFERRKKSVAISYLLWFLGGWYYAYLKKIGWLILFLVTAGGFLIWAIVDLFRIPKLVQEYNNDLALEILRDISIMFPALENQGSEQNVSKKSVNNHYIAQKTQGGESYSFFIIVGIIILFSVSAFYFKPNRIVMQNKIVNEMMINQPQLVKMIKNLLVGDELTDKNSKNFIVNVLFKNGYENIGSYEEDLVLYRKLCFREKDSDKSLVTAYGFMGFTKVFFRDENLREENIFIKNNIPQSNNKGIERSNFQRIAIPKPANVYNDHEEVESNIIQERDKQSSDLQSREVFYKEDSIKI